MVLKSIVGLVGATFLWAGCAVSNSSMISDQSVAGEVRHVGVSWNHSKSCNFGYSSAYGSDERLLREQWFNNGQVVRDLTFYDNGLLKSEEVLKNGQVVHGMYYNENGELERKKGGNRVDAVRETESQLEAE